MAMCVAVGFKRFDKFSTVIMIGDQSKHQGEFGMQPTSGKAVSQPQPYAEHNCQYRAGGHDAIIQLAFHDLEAFLAGLVFAHGVIDE